MRLRVSDSSARAAERAGLTGQRVSIACLRRAWGSALGTAPQKAKPLGAARSSQGIGPSKPPANAAENALLQTRAAGLAALHTRLHFSLTPFWAVTAGRRPGLLAGQELVQGPPVSKWRAGIPEPSVPKPAVFPLPSASQRGSPPWDLGTVEDVTRGSSPLSGPSVWRWQEG